MSVVVLGVGVGVGVGVVVVAVVGVAFLLDEEKKGREKVRKKKYEKI